MTECPACFSTDISKNGMRNQKQRYICKSCKKVFTDNPKYSIVQKKSVIKAYIWGAKIREIARLEKIPFQVVAYWIKSIREKAEPLFPRKLEDFTRSQCKNLSQKDDLFAHKKDKQ